MADFVRKEASWPESNKNTKEWTAVKVNNLAWEMRTGEIIRKRTVQQRILTPSKRIVELCSPKLSSLLLGSLVRRKQRFVKVDTASRLDAVAFV